MRVLIVIALIVAVALANDHCNAFPDCKSCVASTFCGWCSVPVVYKDGSKGFQCAGFNKNGSNPFICPSIYSTDTCERGWNCNKTSYTCDLAAPGAGHQKAECESNCSTTGKTFICDNSTHVCKIAPAGEGTSHAQCESECAASHAPSSHHPSSHHPSSHHPSSHHPSSQHPSSPKPTSAPTYKCNGTTAKCEQAPVGQGSSMAVCEQGCKPSNHTPTSLMGLWRTFPIDEKTPVQETDINFFANNTVGIKNTHESSVCTVSSIGEEVHFHDCSNSQPDLKCLFQTSLTMPETYHAMLACNYQNGAAPASFEAGMADAANGEPIAVVFLSKCVTDGYCMFHFGPDAVPPPSMAAHNILTSMETKKDQAVSSLKGTDPCTNYGSNCTYCLSHQFCGWCSANVVYKDGQAGNQCAGFNPDPRKKNQWTCPGSYSTEMCLPGWACDPVNQTCTPTKAGSGVPKKDCSTSCKAKPGPPSQLIGNWRGLFINQGYPFGIVTVNITESSIVAAFGGKTLFEGSMKSLAADVFITYTSGPNKGKTIAGIFTNDENELIEYIEIAFGGDNEAAPANYKDGMKKPDMELVLAKCASKDCKF